MNWSEYFYDMANLVAKKSKDQSTQIGAVIVGPDNEIRSTGYNSFPKGLNDDLQERQERPEKYYWIEPNFIGTKKYTKSFSSFTIW